MWEHLWARLADRGRVFPQAEGEIAVIQMVAGAACGGVRVMTSSSSPGSRLMEGGLSYIAVADLPCVVVDMMRGGPGLGNIQPSQADYFQVTRSAGHGDYHPIVLAPASIQEAIDFTVLAFELADRYRHLVILAADGLIGQMMEAAELPPMQPVRRERPDYALTGAEGRKRRVITSVYMQPEAEAAYNQTIQNRLRQIKHAEQRSTEYRTEDADLLVIGYGTAGRIALSAVEEARARGQRVGLFRPQTLWPFPEERLSQLLERVWGCLVVEMNAGQMLEDVRLVAQGHVPISFYGQMGGLIPDTEDILEAIDREYARWSRPQPVVSRSLVGEMP